jgi:hypothetical protein
MPEHRSHAQRRGQTPTHGGRDHRTRDRQTSDLLRRSLHGDGTVSNTTSNVGKLRLAYERLQQSLSNPEIVGTKRQVAALVGLWTWSSHTLNESVNSSFEMLRLHSSIAASQDQWDDPIKLSVTDVNTIGRAITSTLANVPARPIGVLPPPTRDSDYAATVIVDASRTGYGALVLLNGHVLEVKGGVFSEKPHSAHAEPLAASVLLDWIRTKTSGPLAIVTDHIALAQGQRRPFSGNGASQNPTSSMRSSKAFTQTISTIRFSTFPAMKTLPTPHLRATR